MATRDLAATWVLNVGPGVYAKSPFGKGAYGVAAYGQGGFSRATKLALFEALGGGERINITLAANLQFAPVKDLAGTLVIHPTFSGNLVTNAVDLAGRLNLKPSFAGRLSELQAFGGAWALNVSFKAHMGLQTVLGGAWTLSVDIGVPDDVKVLVSPLWGAEGPCAPPLWTTSTLCPDPPWTPETGYLPSIYNVGPYGMAHYGRGDYAPIDDASAPPSVWTPSEMCHA